MNEYEKKEKEAKKVRNNERKRQIENQISFHKRALDALKIKLESCEEDVTCIETTQNEIFRNKTTTIRLENSIYSKP